MCPNHPTHGQDVPKGGRGAYEHDKGGGARETPPDHDGTALRGGQATTIYVPRASLPGFPKGAKVRTLLRSVAVLDGWLEENEGRSEDEERLRRMKSWRGEALEQLRLELNRARP